MQIIDLGLCDLKLIRPRRYTDDRGWFAEIFSQNRFAEAGLPIGFAQDNQSFSEHGVLRGLHFQVRQPQGKLIRVLTGHIWDVAVDLRRASRTFGQWTAVELKARNAEGELELLWIPEGFAHGFLVLSESAEVEYKVTRPYDPGGEQTILWNDPDLNVAWPLERLEARKPVVSQKDEAGVRFRNATVFA